MRAWRNAVLAGYLASGLAVSAWLTRLPAIADALGLSPATLGAVLLTQTVAAFVSVSTSGMTVLRLGASLTLRLTSAVVVAGLVLIGLGVSVFASLPVTVAGMLLFGLGSATWNVAANVEGAALESGLGKHVMPVMHAFFSIGTVLGAAVGALASAARVPVVWHVGGMAAVVLALVWGSLPFLRGEGTRVRPEEPRTDTGSIDLAALAADRPARGMRAAWRDPRTVLIGVFTLGVALAEGAANDWVALALTTGYGTSEALGAVGYGVFVAAMTTGRLAGTPLLDRFGRVAILRAACSLALVGLAVFIVSPWLELGIAGLFLWGLGASLGFPVGMSAASDDRHNAAANVSVVSTLGYGAFLGGPPLLGLLGEAVGVRYALAAVAALVVVSLLLVPALRAPATAHRPAGRGR
ncbi:MFS transporter [Kocuria rosea]|uniref:MFS transporter n=1 Tax=Kocuria rosea TaxID=1275 RepID=UPI00203AC865|nr:MFS transporter [Kocuria rosea]MCM3687711.1 MFS transporter [Kocuria rosea]